MLIFQLLSVAAPNYRNPPLWQTPEILYLFQTLNCPYTIRPDAITAVGAPNSISYLAKAIYWLFTVVKTYFNSDDVIPEEAESVSAEERDVDLFKVLLQ